jgi:hypothetical protein
MRMEILLMMYLLAEQELMLQAYGLPLRLVAVQSLFTSLLVC